MQLQNPRHLLAKERSMRTVQPACCRASMIAAEQAAKGCCDLFGKRPKAPVVLRKVFGVRQEFRNEYMSARIVDAIRRHERGKRSEFRVRLRKRIACGLALQ